MEALKEFLLYLHKFLEVEGMVMEVIEVEVTAQPPLQICMRVEWTPRP